VTAAFLVAATAMAWPAGRADAQIALGFEPVASGLSSPLGVVNAGDGSRRLFILEQTGRIRVWDGTQLRPTPFLDVSSLISCCSERGLLGLAFHPGYTTNGIFFVHYTNTSGDTTIVRYRVSADPNVADTTSAQIILSVAQPFANHNGGQLVFGPDGFLYIGLGDGGDAGDPGNRAQNLGTLLGKILRIDVDGAATYAIPATNPFRTTPGALPEIWAYGLRNPWRFSFDRLTGDLFIADVGQGAREEVNFQPAASAGGQNYGWRRMEGTACFNPSTACNDGTLTLPILEYDHSLGCSITGGYRYRGARFPQFVGRYFYGDFCTGRIWTGIQSGSAWTGPQLLDTTMQITSFGEDEDGELYVVHYGSGSNGTLQRVVDTNQAFPLTVSRAGAGAGTVSGPAGINCGSVCSATFGAGAVVTLTATPAAGSAFAGWSGGGCSGTGSCVVTVTAATTVTATFSVPTFTLTVTRTGTGSGTIISAPAGIGCPVTCSAPFAPGTRVTLTAQADPGSIFSGWSGGGCSGAGSCVVTLNAATTVTATFTFQGFVLTVTAQGPGTVVSQPAGISCGPSATCPAVFSPGTAVALTATAAAGATFSGWSGACAGTTACTVTMSVARAVTATFTTTFGGTFTDDPLVANVTLLKAVHVTELRLAIDRERTRRSLAAVAWTDPVLTPGSTRFRLIHVSEMRTALAQAYQAAARTPPTYTDAVIVANQTIVRAAHLAELRAAVRALQP
jgi:glucose/arabinose dehydrogenase